MASVAPPATTTYEYGGAQQGYNQYDAYSKGGAASSYQWPQPGAAQQAPHQPAHPPQVFVLVCA